MKTQNYHNEEVEFQAGEKVNHVTDSGEIVVGTIRATITPDLLEIDFAGGDEGTEKANSCYHA